jgi:hypothetical protein
VGLSSVEASRLRVSTRPWVRAQVVSCSRPGRTGETQIGQPSGAEMTWTLPPWCLCFPPEPPEVGAVGAGGSDAVGTEDGAVQVEMGMAGGHRPFHRSGQIRGVVGEYGQPLVQVAVRGGYRNPVAGELGQPTPRDRVPLRVPSRSRCSRKNWARVSGVSLPTSSVAV